MLTIFILVVAIIAILFVLNRSAVRKLFSAASAGVGKAAQTAWAQDPVAVYKDQVEKLAEQLREASNALVTHQGLIRTLKQRYAAAQVEYNKIEAKIKVALRENRNADAEHLALTLSSYKTKLETTLTSIQSAETVYQTQLNNVKNLKERILELKENTKNYAADLQISKVERDVATLSEKFNAQSINFDDLSEAESEIKKQINENKSKVQVSQDLNGSVPDDREVDRKAQADELLKSIKEKL
jgi:phage shock protein A